MEGNVRSFLSVRGKVNKSIQNTIKNYPEMFFAYIDLSKMNEKQLANIAIIKQKIEDDFVSYKLNMFFQLMYDTNILTKEEYQMIVYGTTDKKKMDLVKMGLTINIINRLADDKQIDNIEIDTNNNLKTNERFKAYKREVDDFYRFELDKFL